ncbi:hypothetical protein POPTR_002G048101v4 [Populus trichocarpa]|uniref:Uncharacterized protein n=1 Tax=Populus trichocarpa TaxID=3694 RepID=A0ACC0TC81_POPTR|nr:hypothetical protein POPTR_002G048101v4 [Populus trichocarpa]
MMMKFEVFTSLLWTSCKHIPEWKMIQHFLPSNYAERTWIRHGKYSGAETGTFNSSRILSAGREVPISTRVLVSS